MEALESDDSDTPAPFTARSSTRTEHSQEHVNMPSVPGEATRKKVNTVLSRASRVPSSDIYDDLIG